jgi:hypothetical protein
MLKREFLLRIWGSDLSSAVPKRTCSLVTECSRLLKSNARYHPLTRVMTESLANPNLYDETRLVPEAPSTSRVHAGLGRIAGRMDTTATRPVHPHGFQSANKRSPPTPLIGK